jgi:hypothetical protein
MGNTIDTDTRANMTNLFRQILNIQCKTLDVSNAIGLTGYIDYIKQSDLSEPIVKGVDCFGREFIVWKAECLLTSNNKFTEFKTFTTFFKRYADIDSVLYHTCGHDGQNLFATEGGCKEIQMEFLLKLLTDKNIVLNKEQIENYRIILPNYSNLSDDATLQITIKYN